MCFRINYIATIFFAVSIPACKEAVTTGVVLGTVTLDGSPLKNGIVTFVSPDGKSQPTTAEIVDGKFKAIVPLGEMKVLFSANKVVGQKKMYNTPDSPKVDEVKELIPEKFNTRSQFKLTIKPGTIEESYPLTSK